MRGSTRAVRITVPAVTVTVLIWLLMGCAYLPWFEQAKLTGTKRDFRPLANPAGGGPITDRRVTRAQVLRLLGEPRARSANGRVLAYTMWTHHGIWIQPLCLNTTAGDPHLYALGLEFDDAGVLQRHQLIDRPLYPSIGFATGMSSGDDGVLDFGVLAAIDEANGVVRSHPRLAGSDVPATPGQREEFSVSPQ